MSAMEGASGTGPGDVPAARDAASDGDRAGVEQPEASSRYWNGYHSGSGWSSSWGWGQPYSSWSSWGQPWENHWGYNYGGWQANDSNQDNAGSWASYQRGEHFSAHADEQSSEESGHSHGQSGSYEPGTTSSRRDSGLESQETADTGGRPAHPGTTTARTEVPGQDSKGGISERMAVPTFSADKSGDELGSSARSYLRK